MKRNLLWGALAVAGLFVAANLILAAFYSGKTYPGSQIAGKHFGSVSFDKLSARIPQAGLLPHEVTLAYGQKQQAVAVTDLGISVDTPAMRSAMMKRSWLPVINALHPTDTALSIRGDEAVFNQKMAELAATVNSTPTEGSITLDRAVFTLKPAVEGKSLDITKSRQAVITALEHGDSKADLAISDVQPKVTNQSLSEAYGKLKAAQSTRISYSFGGKQHAATAADISGLFQWGGDAFKLSDANIRAYVISVAKQLGVSAKNLDDAVNKTRQAVSNAQPIEVKLEGSKYVPLKTITYCTGVRGVDSSYLPELDRKLAMTYADERGWALPGDQVNFVHTTNGCNFTVWLSSAEQMASFGAICDPVWSCTVTPNVVINFDRWTGATDPWNAAKGNIDDYHAMAINHETGHELSFNHKNCGGAGQPAPVMQQQSVDLQGCTFNPWPSTAEQAEFRTLLGI